MSEDSSEKGIEQCSIEEYICDGCDIVFYESDKLLLHYLQQIFVDINGIGKKTKKLCLFRKIIDKITYK